MKTPHVRQKANDLGKAEQEQEQQVKKETNTLEKSSSEPGHNVGRPAAEQL